MDDDPNLVPQHPLVQKAAAVKEASDALLALIPKRHWTTFMAKANLAFEQRAEAAKTRADAMSTERAAKGGLNSGATIKGWWNAIDEEGRLATRAIVESAIDLGCTSNEAIANYVGNQFEFVANQFMTTQLSTLGPVRPELLTKIESDARERARGFRDLVTSMRHDIEKKQGTFAERKVRWITDRPTVGWAIIAYLLLTSILGTIELGQKFWKALGSGGENVRAPRDAG